MFYLRNRLSVGATIEAHEHDEVVPVPQERGAVGKGRRVAPVQRGRERAEPEDGHVLHHRVLRDPAGVVPQASRPGQGRMQEDPGQRRRLIPV